MPDTRIMNGVRNFEHTKLGTLAIGAMVRRNPEPVYESECRCGAKSTVTQRELRNGSARCRAAGCGRTVAPAKNKATEIAHLAKQREEEALRLQNEASLARMAADTADHKLPLRLRPVPANTAPMSARQTSELKARREELEAADRAERERREAPLRAAQAKLNQTHRALARVEKERLEGAVKDPDAFSDPALTGQRMTEAEADQFNRAEFAKYRADHPDLYVTGELVDNLGRYFGKNGLHLVSAAMLDKAVSRFRDAGLLTERPAPQPVVKRAETPAPVPAKPTTVVGRDPATGREREYTSREVDRMSSEEYRRTFQVLGTVAELFTAQARFRERS